MLDLLMGFSDLYGKTVHCKFKIRYSLKTTHFKTLYLTSVAYSAKL